MACQLVKYCHWIEDTAGFRMELRYLRDTDRREVDFVVLRDGRPQWAVECKNGERAISPSVRYFAERTPIPRFYQVHRRNRHYESGKVTVLPFGSPRIRAVKKEKKLYLWVWSAVADPGARFENLVACQLLKYCHWIEDTEGHRMELRYLRVTDRREVDFVVLRAGRAQWAAPSRLFSRLPPDTYNTDRS